DAVAQALVLADARGQTRVEKAAAEHVVAKHERRIVWIIVAEFQIETGDEDRVRFVGRGERLIDGRDLLVQVRHARKRLRTLPTAEEIGGEFRDLVLVEIADDRKGPVRRAVEVLIELLDL